MHRIDTDGATADNKFSEGNSALAVPATVVGADFLNAVQEEIAQVIEGAGIGLDKSKNTQLLLAVKTLQLAGQVAQRARRFYFASGM